MSERPNWEEMTDEEIEAARAAAECDTVEQELERRFREEDEFSVSSTLDRLLDSRFDMAAEAETDLGEIMHKGEKVIVKIKVERGE